MPKSFFDQSVLLLELLPDNIVFLKESFMGITMMEFLSIEQKILHPKAQNTVFSKT